MIINWFLMYLYSFTFKERKWGSKNQQIFYLQSFKTIFVIYISLMWICQYFMSKWNFLKLVTSSRIFIRMVLFCQFSITLKKIIKKLFQDIQVYDFINLKIYLLLDYPLILLEIDLKCFFCISKTYNCSFIHNNLVFYNTDNFRQITFPVKIVLENRQT